MGSHYHSGAYHRRFYLLLRHQEKGKEGIKFISVGLSINQDSGGEDLTCPALGMKQIQEPKEKAGNLFLLKMKKERISLL